MWLIAGLGNPGPRYSRTRHNAGFLVIEEITKRLCLKPIKEEDSRIWIGKIDGNEVILIEPLTFMNLSGSAIERALRQFKVPNENLIVIHDDIDMETGKLRIRKGGSSGGHRGVESIISSLGDRDFIRVKIGIGRDKTMAVEDYVLSRFKEEEIPLISETIAKAADSVISIVTEGVDKAMNKFNKS